MNRFSTFWEDSLNVLLGALLFVSPWLFGFAGEQTAAFNAYVVGGLIIVMALAALFAFRDWEEWISGVLGVWLIAAPWILGFSAHSAATLTHVLIGIATVILALLASNEHYTGHAAGS